MNKKYMSFTTKISSLLLLGVTIGLGIFLLFRKLFVIRENLDGDDNYEIDDNREVQTIYTPQKKKSSDEDDIPTFSTDYPS